MEWSREEVAQLIELYRDRPVLWDSRDVHYKDRSERNEAMNQISQALEMDKVEIDRKIKNLQSHFSRECKKERETRKGRTNYQSKWFAYDALQFLKDRPKVERKASSDAHDFSASETESSSQGPIASDFLSGISIIAAPEQPARKRFKRRSEEECFPEMIINDSELRISGVDDKFSLWAKVWGSKMRELPTEQVIHAEKLINDVLYEASLGNLSRKCSLTLPPLVGND